MAISNAYPKGIPVEDADLFVGSKAYTNRTVNYTAQGIADYLNINAKVSIGGQMTFKFSVVPNVSKTIAFEGGFGNNTPFADITRLVVSGSDGSGSDITIFLDYLVDSKILLAQQNQPNNFGHYKILSYTQIGITDFYNLDLEYIGGNGNIVDEIYYDMVSFSLGSGGGAVDSVNSDTGIVTVDIQSVLDQTSRTWTKTEGDIFYEFEVWNAEYFRVSRSNIITGDFSDFYVYENQLSSVISTNGGVDQVGFGNDVAVGFSVVNSNSLGGNSFQPNKPRTIAGNVNISNPSDLPTGDYFVPMSVNGNLANADGEIDLSSVYYPLSSNPANYISQDPVLEFANFASFPAIGAVSTIYVALDTGFAYTWYSGAYHLSSSPNIGISGFGTTNYIPLFTPNGVTLGNSYLSQASGFLKCSTGATFKNQKPLELQRGGSYDGFEFWIGNSAIPQGNQLMMFNTFKNQIYTKGDFTITECAGSGTFVKDLLIVKLTGQLNIPVTPTTGTTSDFVLLRDTSGNVKQIAYPAIQSVGFEQNFLLMGS